MHDVVRVRNPLHIPVAPNCDQYALQYYRQAMANRENAGDDIQEASQGDQRVFDGGMDRIAREAERQRQFQNFNAKVGPWNAR